MLLIVLHLQGQCTTTSFFNFAALHRDVWQWSEEEEIKLLWFSNANTGISSALLKHWPGCQRWFSLGLYYTKFAERWKLGAGLRLAGDFDLCNLMLIGYTICSGSSNWTFYLTVSVLACERQQHEATYV